MPPKLRSEIILESQGSGSDVVEAEHEIRVPTIVEQLEKNAANFLQEKFASNNPIGQEAGIGNIDVPIHFLNAIKKFKALIEELNNQNLVTTHVLKKG